MARCGPDGRWAGEHAESADPRERDDSWDDLIEQIAAERVAYRAGGQSRWQVARAASIKRERAKQRVSAIYRVFDAVAISLYPSTAGRV